MAERTGTIPIESKRRSTLPWPAQASVTAAELDKELEQQEQDKENNHHEMSALAEHSRNGSAQDDESKELAHGSDGDSSSMSTPADSKETPQTNSTSDAAAAAVAVASSAAGAIARSASASAQTCSFCCDNPAIVFVNPCLHFVCCQTCFECFTKTDYYLRCAFCRTPAAGYQNRDTGVYVHIDDLKQQTLSQRASAAAVPRRAPIRRWAPAPPPTAEERRCLRRMRKWYADGNKDYVPSPSRGSSASDDGSDSFDDDDEDEDDDAGDAEDVSEGDDASDEHKSNSQPSRSRDGNRNRNRNSNDGSDQKDESSSGSASGSGSDVGSVSDDEEDDDGENTGSEGDVPRTYMTRSQTSIASGLGPMILRPRRNGNRNHVTAAQEGDTTDGDSSSDNGSSNHEQ